LKEAKTISRIVRKSKYNYHDGDIYKKYSTAKRPFPNKFEKNVMNRILKEDKGKEYYDVNVPLNEEYTLKGIKQGCKVISAYLDIEAYNNVAFKNNHPAMDYMYNSNSIMLSPKRFLTKYEFSALYNVWMGC
jgi:hypothetical protein